MFKLWFRFLSVFFMMLVLSAPTAWARGGSWFGALITDHTTKSGQKAVKLLAFHPLGPFAGKLKEGSVILKFGGRRIKDIGQFVSAANNLQPGSHITLDFINLGARQRSVNIKTVAWPKWYIYPAVCPPDKKDAPKKVNFFIIQPPKGSKIDPVDAELSWMKRVTGCTVSKSVSKGFRAIYKISVTLDLNYSKLVDATFKGEKAKKVKREKAKKPVKTSKNDAKARAQFLDDALGKNMITPKGHRELMFSMVFINKQQDYNEMIDLVLSFSKPMAGKHIANVVNPKLTTDAQFQHWSMMFSKLAQKQKSRLIEVMPTSVYKAYLGRHKKLDNKIKKYWSVCSLTTKNHRKGLASCTLLLNSGWLDPVKRMHVYKTRGTFYLEQKKLKKAIADYSEVIDLNPKLSFGYLARGYARERDDQHSGAVEDFTMVIRLSSDPKVVIMAHVGRGSAHLSLKHYNRAIADYTYAIDRGVNKRLMYHNRGVARQKLGQKSMADRDFKRARELKRQKKALENWKLQ